MADLLTRARWQSFIVGDSGPLVARIFHRLLALWFLVAWLSLGVQVEGLIGSHGLIPINALLQRAKAHGAISFGHFPTLFYWGASDGLLRAGIIVGVVLALLALAGVATRVCIGLSSLLYLSYAVAATDFLAFQWDNLLVECGLLAVFLPRRRQAPWIHFLFMVLLFKLYFESGIAKWQSYLGDWQNGSAMTYYYETAPLPTWVAWYFHHLPVWWHHFESRATLVLELVIPFGIFAGRRGRRVALVAFSGFQLLDIATANYGFFCYLALSLNVFLLDDGDLHRLGLWLRRHLLHGPAQLSDWLEPEALELQVPRGGWRRWGAVAFSVAYLGLSTLDAGVSFDAVPYDTLLSVRRLVDPWRLVNTYHLFGSVTTKRIEPQVEIEQHGAWEIYNFHHKPGDVKRAPDFVAPHQPRLDFRLWFYGLSYRRSMPLYVRTLLRRLCTDPGAVQEFFAAPLPAHPQAVRLSFWRYHFTTPAQKRATGAWWTRQRVDTMRPLRCASLDAVPSSPGS